ncbi:unnamed protein product, partial [Meganyctiphanes norvegica]
IPDLSGTCSVSVGAPDLSVTPHVTSVDVIFFRLHPWNTVTEFILTIHRGTDNRGDVLCSSPFTCSTVACNINSGTYCDPLPSCTDVFVEVSVDGEVSSESSKTLCEITTSTAAPKTTKPTTTIDFTTTTIYPEGDNLECYSCLGCPDVDPSTHVEANEEYQSCFTAIYAFLGNEDNVVRGGSLELHHEDCQLVHGDFICYCNTDRCNDNHAL